MDGDLPDALHDLHARLLILEHRLGLPMSVADRMIVEAMVQRRADERESARRRDEEFGKAKAEAERVGSYEPIDAFVRKLKRGEFDRYRALE